MEKLRRLRALLGENQVLEDRKSFVQTVHTPVPMHSYAGTDSELETGRRINAPNDVSSRSFVASQPKVTSTHREPRESIDYDLQLGELAPKGESFCAWANVRKYPYAFVGNSNRAKVAEFFDQGKLLTRAWDLFVLKSITVTTTANCGRSFYIHRLPNDPNQTPFLLVTTEQFKEFLEEINQALNIALSVPSRGAGDSFQITFENDGTPQPRYLGCSTSLEMAENLKAGMPPRNYKLFREPASPGPPSDRSLAAFKAKIALMQQAQKSKKLASKEKQKTERIVKQKSWGNSIKRVQRYLGVREAGQHKDVSAIAGGMEKLGLQFGGSDISTEAARTKLVAKFDHDQPAPYDPEGSIVFVSIDIEANERVASQITEIGVATLDTRDLKSLVPGKNGSNWRSKIRARHFRINEYKHVRNSEFVEGCPDNFEFGASEFINLRDAPHMVSTCFKPPFSGPGGDHPTSEEEPKRNVILVGHGVGADINYLRTIGYDVHNLSNLQEVVDTTLMWQYLKRDTNPRNLGSVLAELDIAGWHLHNAGNDAVYTLQAMVAIAIQQLSDREKGQDIKDKEKKSRVEESVREAIQVALDKADGWSSGSDDCDRGVPLALVPPGAYNSGQNSKIDPHTLNSGQLKAQKLVSQSDNPGSAWAEAWRQAQSTAKVQPQSRSNCWRSSSKAPFQSPAKHQNTNSMKGPPAQARQQSSMSVDAPSGAAPTFNPPLTGSTLTELEEMAKNTQLFTVGYE